jgi:hypothetical protein
VKSLLSMRPDYPLSGQIGDPESRLALDGAIWAIRIRADMEHRVPAAREGVYAPALSNI